ncbi:putative sialidase super family, partial [Candidatus Termititenax aidoneus]
MKLLNKLRPSCFVLFILAVSFIPVSLRADVALPNNVNGFATVEGFSDYFESGGGHSLARHNNNLYAVFSDYPAANTNQLIFAKSNDNGVNWTSWPIDKTSGVSTYISGASIAVSSNGSIYISYLIGTSNVNEHKLKVLKTTNEGQSWITANVYNVAEEGLYSDLVISEQGVIVVALSRTNWAGNGITSIYVYTNTESNFTSTFVEEVGGFNYDTNRNGDTLYLSKDKQGNVFLAADYLHNSNYNKTVRVFKRATNGSWSLFAPSSGAYTGQHPAIVNDSLGNLYLAYSVTPNGSGSMDLMYRKYNGSGTEIASNTLLSAPKIYTPQIGLAANTDAPNDVIPVIQFVSGNSGGSAYNIMQISQQSDSIWSVPTASITSGNQAVFLHMLPEIIDDKPDMLWYNNLNNKVYFNRAPDKISPWIPSAPVVRWADQGLNSGSTQKVSASMTALPARSTQVAYDWDGFSIVDTAYTTAIVDTKTNVHDRQQVRARIKAKDAAGNESLDSPYSAYVSLPDRTSPSGSVVINSDGQYTSKNAVSLALAYADSTSGTAGQSGVNGVSINGSAWLTISGA